MRYESLCGENENYGLGCIVCQTGTAVSEKPTTYIFKEEDFDMNLKLIWSPGYGQTDTGGPNGFKECQIN